MFSFAGLKKTPYVLLETMDRPSRKTKAVDYRETTKDVDDYDDDDDFAFVNGPPRKKVREDHVKQREHKKTSSSSSSQETAAQSTPVQKSRKPLDQKLFERDLEAAITLSSLNHADEIKDQSPASKGVAMVHIPVDENTDPALRRLSNCSVDAAVLGLDEISSEKGSPASSRQRKEQKQTLTDEDEDYGPKLTPVSESDDEFSEAEESEDDDLIFKKVSKTKKENVVTKKEKNKPPPACKKEKQQPKAAKSKSAVTGSTPVRSPSAAKTAPRRPAPSSTLSTPKPAVSLSPVGGRTPKWNPPGQIGKSPTSSLNPAAKSPGQGLRLGLSRLVRVKPLHPSVTSH